MVNEEQFILKERQDARFHLTSRIAICSVATFLIILIFKIGSCDNKERELRYEYKSIQINLYSECIEKNKENYAICDKIKED